MQQFLRFCSNKIWHSIIAIVCLALARYYCNVVVLRVRAGLNKDAFYDCANLTSIYYYGTVEQWDSIKINNTNQRNYVLNNATRYYYSEEDPYGNEIMEGNFWHEVNGKIVIWEKK